MKRPMLRKGLSYSDYARRHGVERSTVSRWVRNGVISTTGGLIDPETADAELAANRPLPRGRAASRINAAAAPAAPEAAAPAEWRPTATVLGSLRQHVPVLLARRLAREGFAPATIAIAAIHVIQLLESAIAVAVIDDSADPLGDGTMPPAGVLDLEGAYWDANRERIEADPELDAIVWSEVQTLTSAFCGGDANGVRAEGDQQHGS